jgi:hypothetical protein
MSIRSICECPFSICAIILILIAGCSGAQTQFHDPQDDLGTLQFETYWGASVSTDTLIRDEEFPTWWAYWTLPSFRIADRSVFAAIEMDGVNRSRRYQETEPDALLLRYGLFGGISLLNTPRHRGSLLLGSGVASEASSLSSDDLYLHLIYDHRIVYSDRLTLGLGILFMNHFGRWRAPFNLLPYVNWRMSDRTRLRVAWDIIELRHVLNPRFSISAETRYDLSFFHLECDDSVEFETVGLGGGFDIWLLGDMYLRLRYKNLLLRREIRRISDQDDIDIRKYDGHALKLQVVYAK